MERRILDQNIAVLLQDAINYEVDEQVNFPIDPGIATNRNKLFSAFNESPATASLYKQIRNWKPIETDPTKKGEPAERRINHISGLAHERLIHLVVRALLEGSKCTAFVALSPDATTNFAQKAHGLVMEYERSEDVVLPFLEPDILIVNRKGSQPHIKEDIEASLRGYKPHKKTSKSPPDYFDDKQVRFTHVQKNFPELFPAHSVCRFGLLKGVNLPQSFLPPRHSPYDKQEFKPFVSHFVQEYTPAGILSGVYAPLAEFFSELKNIAHNLAPQPSPGYAFVHPSNQFGYSRRGSR